MKKYLMTWYGITDLRASLGIEQTNGPVLGALLAEDYSDIIILGYSNQEKIDKSESEAQEYFQQKLLEIQNTTQGVDPSEIWKFINEFSNTEQAHNHFVNWLEQQLLTFGNKAKVSFLPVSLRKLNDTEGIYDAATECLDTIATLEGEKLVTLYLSPGTPVMAFVWAFAALRHPSLKKRLLASSNANKPPESIALPSEWLEWHGKQVKTSVNDTDQFDVIFHLFGAQRIPILLGIIQFESKKHVFVNSKQFPAEVMKQFIGDAEFVEIAVDPYDPENVRTIILNMLATMPSNIRVGFNLTGGTKLMYAGALAACRKVNATPFYFNSQNDKVVFLNDFDTVDTKAISSVETFINLNGNDLFVSKPGYWNEIPEINNPDRKRLTLKLWRERFKIQKLYKELAKYNDDSKPFEISRDGISVKLTEDEQAEIHINGGRINFSKWPDFSRYLSGGWFEEFTYLSLEPFIKSGQIKDLRIGLEISFEESSLHSKMMNFGNTYQELDVVFTDGKRLYVVECKAGDVKSDHVMKLQNIVRYLGGIEGQAILASCFSPSNKVIKKKIADSTNLESASGKDFLKNLESIFKKRSDE